VARLYQEVPDGTPVEVVSEPIKLARDGGGRVWLEIHRDVYGGRRPELADVEAAIALHRLEAVVDPARIADVVERAWGTPEDVSAGPLTALSAMPFLPRLE
jgi:hypothetical protein